jgi:hypothetical protein
MQTVFGRSYVRARQLLDHFIGAAEQRGGDIAMLLVTSGSWQT